MDIGRILESLKLSPKYVFAVFTAGAFLLFVPASFLNRMGLTQFRERFLPYIGAVTLLSATLLFAHGVASIVDFRRGLKAKSIQGRAGV